MLEARKSTVGTAKKKRSALDHGSPALNMGWAATFTTEVRELQVEACCEHNGCRKCSEVAGGTFPCTDSDDKVSATPADDRIKTSHTARL